MAEQLVALVDKATSEYLIQTDWAINMQICDTLNREASGYETVLSLGHDKCKEVIKQVAKRMKEKKSRVALLALELVETLVKNCECVHPYVGGKEFQADLIKLIQNKKTKDQVRERALELVQYWADSFQHRKDLPLFNQTALLLRRAGIPFPPRRPNEPPLVFRERSHSAGSTSHNVHPTSAATHNHSRDSGSLKEFSSLQESVNLVMEMLSFTNPEEEDPATNEILRDLITTCKEAVPNLRNTIETGNFTSEAQMIGLLALNDELVKVQEMYDDLIARRQVFIAHGPAKPSPTKASAPPQKSNTNLLDDLDLLSLGSAPAQAPPQTQSYSQPYPQTQTYPSQPQTYPPQPQPQPVAAQQYKNPFFDTGSAPQPAPPQGDDEFDMLAKSRHSVSLPTPLQPSLQPSLQPTTAKPPAQLAFQTNTTTPFSNIPSTTSAYHGPTPHASLTTTAPYHSSGALFPPTAAATAPSLAGAHHLSANALYTAPQTTLNPYAYPLATQSSFTTPSTAQYVSAGGAPGPFLSTTPPGGYPSYIPSGYGQPGLGQQPNYNMTNPAVQGIPYRPQ